MARRGSPRLPRRGFPGLGRTFHGCRFHSPSEARTCATRQSEPRPVPAVPGCRDTALRRLAQPLRLPGWHAPTSHGSPRRNVSSAAMPRPHTACLGGSIHDCHAKALHGPPRPNNALRSEAAVSEARRSDPLRAMALPGCRSLHRPSPASRACRRLSLTALPVDGTTCRAGPLLPVHADAGLGKELPSEAADPRRAFPSLCSTVRASTAGPHLGPTLDAYPRLPRRCFT